MATFLWRNTESLEGVSINKNPPIISMAAVIFQFKKSICLIMTSTKAFRGIPRIVPIEMKSGNVKAIPKLIRKLKANEHKAERHNGNHGI